MINFAEFAWGVVLAAGGGAATTFAAFRFFGEKWLDNKFATRLQDLRHEHERQIESIKLKSSKTLDRAVRVAEREFEITFEAWGLVTNAHRKTMYALPGLRTVSDFSRLSDKLAKIAGEQAGLAEWEIEALLEKPKPERNAFYHERRALNEISSAQKAIWEAESFLSRNALFVDAKIHTELEGFLNWAWSAMIAWEIVGEVRRQDGGKEDLEGIRRDDEEYRKDAKEALKKLETLVRNRLWTGEEV